MNCNQEVKNQYELYPYDPSGKKNSANGLQSYVLEFNYINLFCYNRNFFNVVRNSNPYKILIAGCGIGNNILWIMEQFQKCNVQKYNIIAIDISMNSVNICKKRIKKYRKKNSYKYGNVKVLNLSILDLNPKKWGLFDMVVSIGVLHHLDNPVEGLRILNTCLKKMDLDCLWYMELTLGLGYICSKRL